MRSWWVLLFVACSSAPLPAPVPTPAPPPPADAPPRPDAAIVVAPVDAAVPVVIEEPALPPWDDALSVVPPVKVATKTLETGKSVTLGGVTISFGRANHKHAIDGPAVGMWSFTFARGGKKVPVELRSSEEGFLSEIVEHGQFFVLRHVDYGTFEITHVPTKKKQLTEDACEALIDGKAKAANLPRGNSSSSISLGVLHHAESGWIGFCGTVSGRIWFVHPGVMRRRAAALRARVPVPGTVTSIKESETITIAGIAIKFAGATHKHAVKGPALGRWMFEAARGGKTETIELESTAEGFEAEVAVHGAFLAFRHVDYTKFDIVLGAERAAAPLDQDACVERIRAAATKASLSLGTESGYSTSQGIVTYTAPGWVGHCGTLSQRVWFTKPR
jgi:hypothetical protein